MLVSGWISFQTCQEGTSLRVVNDVRVPPEVRFRTECHAIPRGFKYPIFEASGSKNHTLDGNYLGPESLKIEYLDPLGNMVSTTLANQGPLLAARSFVCLCNSWLHAEDCDTVRKGLSKTCMYT